MSGHSPDVVVPCMKCPSAQPEMADAVILGVRDASFDGALISYLRDPVQVSTELLALSGPLPSTEVFRIAARYEEKACRHFDGSSCHLATRIVQILPVVVDALPPCKIRHESVWFQQEGRPACLRCPQVITRMDNPNEAFRLAAMPRWPSRVRPARLLQRSVWRAALRPPGRPGRQS